MAPNALSGSLRRHQQSDTTPNGQRSTTPTPNRRHAMSGDTMRTMRTMMLLKGALKSLKGLIREEELGIPSMTSQNASSMSNTHI